MSIPEEQKEAKASSTESSSTPESEAVVPAVKPEASSVSSGEAQASSAESSSTPESEAVVPAGKPEASSVSSGEAQSSSAESSSTPESEAVVPAGKPEASTVSSGEAQASSAESSSAPESEAVVPAGEPEASNVSSGEAAEAAEGRYYDDGYGQEYGEGETAPLPVAEVEEKPPTAVVAAGGDSGTPSTPSSTAAAEPDDEEEGMLRMSFLEHLGELRSRILKALGGLGAAFVLCLVFSNELWRVVSKPAIDALKAIGADPNLAQITPMDAFTTIWIKTPMLAAIFVASPWLLYQIWAFIAPGLYRKERRWAAPFVICSAGLFILGGLFAYFVAFRFGLAFLLSIGRDINVRPVVSIVEYFDLFVNVMLGIGLVFELPILVFFLTLLRITTPGFLMRNSRYAILIITIIAAVVTPTPDVFNLMLFAVPMVVLYFIGVFASYLLVLHREDQPFPWKAFGTIMLVILSIIAGVIWIMIARYNYRLVYYWPFLTR